MNSRLNVVSTRAMRFWSREQICGKFADKVIRFKILKEYIYTYIHSRICLVITGRKRYAAFLWTWKEPGGLDRTIKQGSRVIDEMEGEKNLIKIWGPFRTMFHSRYFYFSLRDEKLLEICFSHSVFNLKINSNESNSLCFC